MLLMGLRNFGHTCLTFFLIITLMCPHVFAAGDGDVYAVNEGAQTAVKLIAPTSSAQWTDLNIHPSEYVNIDNIVPPIFSTFGIRSPDRMQLARFEGARAYLRTFFESLSPEELVQVEKFSKESLHIKVEKMALVYGLRQKVRQLFNTPGMGEEGVRKSIASEKDSQAVKFEIEGIGKAELTTIGLSEHAPFVIKISHFGTKIPTLIVDFASTNLADFENFDPKKAKMLQGEELERFKVTIQVAKELRKFVARLIYSDKSPELSYIPIAENLNSKSEKISNEDLKQQLSDLETLPATELEGRTWFQTLRQNASQWYMAAVADIDAEKKSDAVDPNEVKVNVVFVNTELNEHLTTQEFGNPRNALKRLRLWMDATLYPATYDKEVLKKPFGKIRVIGTGSYGFGLSMGLALGAISAGAGIAAQYMGKPLQAGLTPGDLFIVSFAWSAGMAAVSRSYNEWLNRGTDGQRFMKEQVTGILNSLHLYALTTLSLYPLLPDGSLNTVAILAMLNIISNQTIKNYSKPFMKDIPRFRDKSGAAAGNQRIPIRFGLSKTKTLKIPNYRFVLPTKENNFSMLEYSQSDTQIPMLVPTRYWQTKIPRKEFEPQMIQFITTPISMLSRLGFTIGLMNMSQVESLSQATGIPTVILGMAAAIPIGHLLYLSLGPAAQQVYIWYREKIYASQYRLERAEYERRSGRVYHELEDVKFQQTLAETEKLKKDWIDLSIKSSKFHYLLAMGKSLRAYMFQTGAYTADVFAGMVAQPNSYNQRSVFQDRMDELFREADVIWEEYKTEKYRGIPLSQYIMFYKKPLIDASNFIWNLFDISVQKVAALPKNLPLAIAKISVQTEYRARQRVMAAGREVGIQIQQVEADMRDRVQQDYIGNALMNGYQIRKRAVFPDTRVTCQALFAR